MVHESFLKSVFGWLRAGYPEGVPPKDYFPLLALLGRSLDQDEIADVIADVIVSGDATREGIADAIRSVTHEPPTEHEIAQVAGRLAAVGWPLAHAPGTTE